MFTPRCVHWLFPLIQTSSHTLYNMYLAVAHWWVPPSRTKPHVPYNCQWKMFAFWAYKLQCYHLFQLGDFIHTHVKKVHWRYTKYYLVVVSPRVSCLISATCIYPFVYQYIHTHISVLYNVRVCVCTLYIIFSVECYKCNRNITVRAKVSAQSH